MRQKKQILMMACLLGLAGLVSSLPVQTQAYTVAVQQQGRSGGTEEEQARKARYEAKYGAPYGVSWVERNQRKEPNRAVSRRTSSQQKVASTYARKYGLDRAQELRSLSSNKTKYESNRLKTVSKATRPIAARNPKTAVLPSYPVTTDKLVAPVESKEPNVRVLLGSRQSALTVMPITPLGAYTLAYSKVLQSSPQVPLTITVSGNQVYANGRAIGQYAFFMSPQGREKTLFRTLGHTYRGVLSVTAVNGAMRLVNVVPLEEYLYGVVPREAIPSWPKAALEAQAVAARTYALYNMNQNKNKAYDVEPTTYNQVYGGKDSEYVATNAAVDATRGQVMYYNGQPIDAVFHSDGGGYTENSENVWGTVLPYLRGVRDYAHSGSSAWTVNLTKQQLEYKLASAGKGVGSLYSIELSPLGPRPIQTADRGVSGRVKQVVFVGSNGRRTIAGDKLMAILGLKSSLFDFYINEQPPASPETGGRAKHTFTGGNDTVYIKGYGWGHGLGLSQWGATALAEQAPAGDATYYQKILHHYYTNVEIKRAY